jgi:hypothetical protein
MQQPLANASLLSPRSISTDIFMGEGTLINLIHLSEKKIRLIIIIFFSFILTTALLILVIYLFPFAHSTTENGIEIFHVEISCKYVSLAFFI